MDEPRLREVLGEPTELVRNKIADRLNAVEEAYTQCPKALLRSELWNHERHVERSELPSSGEILRAVADPELDVEEYEEARTAGYRRREGFY